MSGRIRIAVIDDHRIFLDGITLLVEGMGGKYSVATYDAPFDLLREIESGISYDLIICDLIMNAMNGLAFIAALRSHTPNIPLLILSGINTAPPLADIKRLGGNGFVHKFAPHNILLSAVESLLSGKNYFEHGLTENMVQNPAPMGENINNETDPSNQLPKLGPRQFDVLKLKAS